MSNLEIILLSVGLAMDASCLCTILGLVHKPTVSRSVSLALPFAIMQGLMPLLGYLGTTLLPAFLFTYDHWIAFVLLEILGGKMLFDIITRPKETADETATQPKSAQVTASAAHTHHATQSNQHTKQTSQPPNVAAITFGALFIQSVCTSIDALAVGITFNAMSLYATLLAVGIISVITFILCFGAIRLGRAVGTRFNGKAELLGALVLMALGAQMLCSGLFG